MHVLKKTLMAMLYYYGLLFDDDWYLLQVNEYYRMEALIPWIVGSFCHLKSTWKDLPWPSTVILLLFPVICIRLLECVAMCNCYFPAFNHKILNLCLLGASEVLVMCPHVAACTLLYPGTHQTLLSLCSSCIYPTRLWDSQNIGKFQYMA